MLQAYIYDRDFYFVGAMNCQLDPLETQYQGKEIYIQPGDSTLKKPLKEKEGFRIKYNKEKDKWEYEEIKKEESQVEYIPTELDNLYLQLAKVEHELRNLDYIGVKIATGRATIEEYSDEIARMNVLADKVNELKEKIAEEEKKQG